MHLPPCSMKWPKTWRLIAPISRSRSTRMSSNGIECRLGGRAGVGGGRWLGRGSGGLPSGACGGGLGYRRDGQRYGADHWPDNRKRAAIGKVHHLLAGQLFLRKPFVFELGVLLAWHLASSVSDG